MQKEKIQWKKEEEKRQQEIEDRLRMVLTSKEDLEVNYR